MCAAVPNGVISELPSEIRMPGWLGPTLFTSEARDGELVTLADFDATLRAHEHAESLVIGTVRETQGTAHAYAAFCLAGIGHVVLVDLHAPYTVRFVNSGSEELATCLATFVSGCTRLREANDAAVPAVLHELRSQLAAIDVAAMSDDDAFWPTSMETFAV